MNKYRHHDMRRLEVTVTPSLLEPRDETDMKYMCESLQTLLQIEYRHLGTEVLVKASNDAIYPWALVTCFDDNDTDMMQDEEFVQMIENEVYKVANGVRIGAYQ